MTWLYLTLGLLATSVCLVLWIYLRDRDTSSYLPPGPTERQLAQIDATVMLNPLAGAHCLPDCTAKLLDRTKPEHWLIRITIKGHPQCLQINLYTFRITPQGLIGVQPTPCPPR